MTVREFINRRKATLKLVVLPLWLAGFVLMSLGGRHGPWTSTTSIGFGVFIASAVIYLAYVGTIRCPRCKGFIGLSTVSVLRNKPPQPERCVHCGLSFRESMDSPIWK